ncbi:hypothetical protein ACYJ1Y_06640 [Natrialbaceae archaeon A-gly3]
MNPSREGRDMMTAPLIAPELSAHLVTTDGLTLKDFEELATAVEAVLEDGRASRGE